MVAACFIFFVGHPVAAQIKEKEETEEEEPSAMDLGSLDFTKGGAVELNGDVIEYFADQNKMTARGNVVIVHPQATLKADEVDFYRNTSIAHARGHVRLTTPQADLFAQELTYNFDTMTGDFHGTRFLSYPYYGIGKKITRVSDKQMVLEATEMTTCDHDKPHYHLASRKLDVYPQDKIIARNVRFIVGKVPLLYLLKFTKDLKEKRPHLHIVPGKKKKWGVFTLTTARYYINDYLMVGLTVDYRSRRGIGTGAALEYAIPEGGSGVIKGYVMDDRNRTLDHHTDEERYKYEWRHKWDINEATDFIAQFYKIKDSEFLEDFFELERDEDDSPDTFALLTHNFPSGTLSLRTDARVNPYETIVEKLPEVRYDLQTQEIVESGFFLKNKTTASSLVKKEAKPSTVKLDTNRLDFDNEVSYPFKLSIIEVTPFVGGSETYYSQTAAAGDDVLRGQFRAGTSMTTKFFKVFDAEGRFWDPDVKRLRHIVTPIVTYEYSADPTVPASNLFALDGIDAIDNRNNMNFALENKIQVKKDDESIDLLRWRSGIDYKYKQDPGGKGFDQIKTEVDLRPVDWINFYFDSLYSTRTRKLNTANFDFYINGKEKQWSLALGKRYNRLVDDQITADFSMRLNPKWSFRIYERYDILGASLKEQEYRLSRDLHEWILDIIVNDNKSNGNTILFVLSLKAFPGDGLEFGSQLHRRAPGSQLQNQASAPLPEPTSTP
jgi:lipopolysaccharide assembly outer membrane protein LptD (OstA)